MQGQKRIIWFEKNLRKHHREKRRQRTYCMKRLENIAEDWYNEKKTER